MVTKHTKARRIVKTPKSKRETRIAIVVDRSGSMLSIRQAALESINGQIETIKNSAKLMGDTYVTYINFNSSVSTVFANRDANTIYPITLEQYNPNGGTAIRDAMGDAILALQSRPITCDNTAYLVILVSDGEENSSKRYTQPQMSSMVKMLTDTGNWTFTYMMSNLSDADMAKFKSEYNAQIGNMATFTSTNDGVGKSAYLMNSGLRSYAANRSEDLTAVKTFYSDGSGYSISGNGGTLDLTSLQDAIVKTTTTIKTS